MRLTSGQSLMLIVDLQAGLLPVIERGEQALREAGWLGALAASIDVPVWVTEQYPKGLGGTAPALLEAIPDCQVWQKQHFDAHAEPGFSEALKASERHQIVICGTEAHICVMQTGLGLLEAGYEVYWLVEASASRRAAEAVLAKERMVQAGAVAVTADMVAYEWLHCCGDERFKQAHKHFLKPRAARPLIF